MHTSHSHHCHEIYAAGNFAHYIRSGRRLVSSSFCSVSFDCHECTAGVSDVRTPHKFCVRIIFFFFSGILLEYNRTMEQIYIIVFACVKCLGSVIISAIFALHCCKHVPRVSSHQTEEQQQQQNGIPKRLGFSFFQISPDTTHAHQKTKPMANETSNAYTANLEFLGIAREKIIWSHRRRHRPPSSARCSTVFAFCDSDTTCWWPAIRCLKKIIIMFINLFWCRQKTNSRNGDAQPRCFFFFG